MIKAGYVFAAFAALGGVLAGLLLIASVLIVTTLHPPSPTPAEVGQEQQGHSGNESQTTNNPEATTQNNPPAFDDTIQTDPKAGDGEQQRADGDDESPIQWWEEPMLLFTAILAASAILQLVLYFTQSVFMFFGLRATMRAANAAKKSADVAEQAMHTSERAYLGVDDVFWMAFGDPDAVNLSVTLTNTGRTPADIKTAVARFYFSNGDTPDAAEAANCDFSAVGKLCAGKPMNVTFTYPGEFPQDRSKQLKAGQLNFWLCVAVSFRDAFAKDHAPEFWWQYSKVHDSLIRYAGPH